MKKIGPGGGVDGEKIVPAHCRRCKRSDAWLDERIAGGAVVDARVYVGLHFALR